MAAHSAAIAEQLFTPHHYRSSALRSPDGRWLAYSRIHFTPAPQLHASQVESLLLLEDLLEGRLQAQASSPFPSAASSAGTSSAGTSSAGTADPFAPAADCSPSPAGSIAILMPIAWNQTGDRLLARQFEGRFCSSMATDYALIWETLTGQVQTLTPPRQEQAMLLGWSQRHPQAVLFEAGSLYDSPMPRWRMTGPGAAVPAPEDQPLGYGEAIADSLMGPQTHRR
ncbi:MAG: hypothetical protein HC824_22120 [Synechococcales cyanobacterium RM1_1_8]|nr:hypothetical protein [Synechococcales cyanobacterium RM1_1_8]